MLCAGDFTGTHDVVVHASYWEDSDFTSGAQTVTLWGGMNFDDFVFLGVDMPPTIPIPTGLTPTSHCRQADGSLCLASTTEDNAFGFWKGPGNAIPYIDDALYRISFTLTATSDAGFGTPVLRLRVNAEDETISGNLTLNSYGRRDAGPGPTSKTFECYFDPHERGEFEGFDHFYVSLDMLDFNPGEAGDISLHRVEVDTIQKSAIHARTVREFDSDADFAKWVPVAYSWSGYPTVTTGTVPGGVTLTSNLTTDNDTGFGYWQVFPEEAADATVDITSGTLYRAQFTVENSNPALCPRLRFRFGTEDSQHISVLEIFRYPDRTYRMPDASGKVYTVYLMPPDQPAGAHPMENGLMYAFDMLDFVNEEAGEVRLVNVKIQECTLP